MSPTPDPRPGIIPKLLNEALSSFQDGRRSFELLFSSALYGVISFNLIHAFHFLDPSNKSTDFYSYILGWALFLPGGVLLATAQKLWEKKNSTPRPIPGLCVTSAHFLFALFLIHPRWTAHIGPFFLALLFLIFHALGLSGTKIIKSLKKMDPLVFEHRTYTSMSIAFALWLLTFTYKDIFFRPWSWPGLFFFAGVIFFMYFGIPRSVGQTAADLPRNAASAGGSKTSLYYFLVFLSIFFLLTDPRFGHNSYHNLFFLGPICDLINGKSLLVDINAQYGVLIFYFLKSIFAFFPVGHSSFVLLLTVLTILQYFLFFFIARQLLGGWIRPAATLAALLAVNHFGHGYAILLPSIGPLRFGFIYLLMALVLLRERFPNHRRWFLSLEILTTGAAFFWSFEVFVYTVPAYLAFMLFESIKFGKTIAIDLGSLLKKTLFFAGCMAAIACYLYADIFQRTGTLPHWSYYFDLVFMYRNGYGMFPMPKSGFWLAIVGAYYLSLLAALGALSHCRLTQRSAPPHLNAVLLLTFYGIFQFFYYLGRAHPTNLFHICMPSLLLASYWLHVLRRSDPSAIPTPMKKWGYALIAIYAGVFLQTPFSLTVTQIQDRVLRLPTLWESVKNASRDLPRDDAFAQEANRLMDKYSGNKKSLVYFFGVKGAEVEMYTARTKVYPYNDVIQAGFCPATRGRILSFDPRLRIGDFIYVSKRLFADVFEHHVPEFFEDDLLADLQKRFKLEPVEESDEIFVYRVAGGKPDQRVHEKPFNGHLSPDKH